VVTDLAGGLRCRDVTTDDFEAGTSNDRSTHTGRRHHLILLSTTSATSTAAATPENVNFPHHFKPCFAKKIPI